MNRCDTCQYAEFEFSYMTLRDECVDCTLDIDINLKVTKIVKGIRN